MTTGHSNPLPSSPIDEGDLLALVEGTPLPPERAAQLRQALAADPRLAELAALMRADRDAVASLPEVHAPADLLDRVEVLLERDALVGLARTEATAPVDDLPVSAVIPARRPWLTTRTGTPLAAGAALLLIAGGVLMLNPGKPIKPLAPTNPNADGTPANTDLAGSNGAAPNDDPVGKPAPAINDIATDNARPPAVENVSPDAPAPAAIAAAAPVIPPERLLAAAAEGRLVLRLRGPIDRAAGRIKALQGNSRSIEFEPLSEPQSAEAGRAFVDAWTLRRSPPDILRPLPSRPEPGPFASHNPAATPRPAPVVAVEIEPALPAEPAPQLASQGFVALVPATADGLASLRNAIDNKTVPADWQILETPLLIESPTDAASVLWWTSAPSNWARRCTVPIIVQTN